MLYFLTISFDALMHFLIFVLVKYSFESNFKPINM